MNTHIEQSIHETFLHLEGCLSLAFEHTPVAELSQLIAFLPDCNPSARKLILGELIKLDMAKAAELGQFRPLSYYAEILKEVFDDGLPPLDLVLDEIQIRREFDLLPSNVELQKMYPHLADILDQMLSRDIAEPIARTVEKPPLFHELQTIDEFTILRLLGQGAFANVYLAKQQSMMRLVALKASHRKSDEPIALSQLDHPNVVRVYDQRRISEPESHLLYMEYVPGGTLSEVIQDTRVKKLEELSGRQLLATVDKALVIAEQQRPERSQTREQLSQMEWSAVVAWLGVQLAEGIAAAHRSGVMHRDIKPANILVSAEGVPKLADFNVSFGSMAGCSGAAVHFGGSLAYMSPEQLQVASPFGTMKAEQLDHRSDLYSLAVVLWELWQGKRPQQAVDLVENWYQAVVQQIELRKQQPLLPRNPVNATGRVLEKTLRLTMSEDRDRRPRSGSEFAGRLRLALHPKAAESFEPAEDSWRAKLLRLPVFLVTSFIIFIPNGIAGALNYQYNFRSIEQAHPELISFFANLSIWINSITFPIGAVILFSFSFPVQRDLKRVWKGGIAPSLALDSAWNLGHRAAMIGGLLWMIAGFLFPLIMGIAKPSFGLKDSLEIFLSLFICGGIAWIYPFFGVSLVSTMVYYPSLIAPTMTDYELAERIHTTKKRATYFLSTAAAIPLLALGLLAVIPEASQAHNGFLFVIVVITSIALPFAFVAHQRLIEQCGILSSVLAAE